MHFENFDASVRMFSRGPFELYKDAHPQYSVQHLYECLVFFQIHGGLCIRSLLKPQNATKFYLHKYWLRIDFYLSIEISIFH